MVVRWCWRLDSIFKTKAWIVSFKAWKSVKIQESDKIIDLAPKESLGREIKIVLKLKVQTIEVCAAHHGQHIVSNERRIVG